MIMSQEQMFLAQYLPAAGLSQLPVGQPPLESGKGRKVNGTQKSKKSCKNGRTSYGE